MSDRAPITVSWWFPKADHPILFARRIEMSNVKSLIDNSQIPTFDEWEQEELALLRRAGPALVVENHDGELLALLRLYGIERRDARAYFELWQLVEEANDSSLNEACLAWFAYVFGPFGLRKLYAEVPSYADLLSRRLADLGFVKEVSLSGYLSTDKGFADLEYYALTSEDWSDVSEEVRSEC